MATAYWKKITAFATAKKISLSLGLLLLVFIICLWILYAVADVVFEDGDLSFDENVFTWIRPHINPENISIFTTITFFGSAEFLVIANLLLVIYFLFLKKDKHNAWKVAVVAISNTLVLLLLKIYCNVKGRKVHSLPGHMITVSPAGTLFPVLFFLGCSSMLSAKTVTTKL